MTLAECILYQNNHHFGLGPTVLRNPIKGVTLHKIDAAQAQRVSDQIATITDIPLPYACACLCIEAIFDAQCENGNLRGSNPQNDPLGYDLGIAQIKLRYLPAPLSLDEKRAFALDITKAIPRFESLMAGHLAWAHTQLATPPTDSQLAPEYRNPYCAATGAYNFGEHGMATRMASDTEPASHCVHVMNLERWFATELGQPSVFT